MCSTEARKTREGEQSDWNICMMDSSETVDRDDEEDGEGEDDDDGDEAEDDESRLAARFPEG